MEEPSGTHIVLISGLSGSGKSTAMAALEDRSFYCVDNLPPQLMGRFLDLCAVAKPPIRQIGLAIDAREGAFLNDLPTAIRELRASGARIELIFLDCANHVLEHRYRETRRVHPLSPDRPVSEGIEAERRLLADVAAMADLVIDTSAMNVHQLRETMLRHLGGAPRQTVVNLVSFGYRHGVPESADLLFDVRFLPNPYFEAELRERTGLDSRVAEFVLASERTVTLLERLGSLLGFLLPLYDEEGKAYITIGIGCTGGQHRSVAVTEALASRLREAGRKVSVSHRDVERRT